MTARLSSGPVPARHDGGAVPARHDGGAVPARRDGDAAMGPLAHYGAVLREAAAGRVAHLDLIDPTATRPARRLAPQEWCADRRLGDAGLLARCTGPTLDVGCGPGRLVAALTATGLPALGVDICAEAVRQARRRGAPAQRACVFGPISGEGGWRHVLLADGNIGIGGDPHRLLRRCRQLLAPGGDILVEVDPPGAGSWQGQAALRHQDRTSRPFPWAVVAADDLAQLARDSALSILDRWTEARRCFARLG
jgi:SAM-dependent methyltransferase